MHLNPLPRVVTLQVHLCLLEGRATHIIWPPCHKLTVIKSPHKCTPSPPLSLQVHLGLLEGRVTHIIWPPSRAHRLAPYVPPGRVAKHAADAL